MVDQESPYCGARPTTWQISSDDMEDQEPPQSHRPLAVLDNTHLALGRYSGPS